MSKSGGWRACLPIELGRLPLVVDLSDAKGREDGERAADCDWHPPRDQVEQVRVLAVQIVQRAPEVVENERPRGKILRTCAFVSKSSSVGFWADAYREDPEDVGDHAPVQSSKNIR